MNITKTKNLNYKFLILQTIGIILVVLGHGKNEGLYLFTDWFPQYSFHMPLFIFISGYFYKKENSFNYKEYIIKKAKKLLIPFFIWNLIYGIIVNIFKYYNIIDFGQPININTLFFEAIRDGSQFRFNLVSWFVITLFIIEITYVLFRKLNVLNNEYLIMLFLLFIGLATIIVCNYGFNQNWCLPIVRVLFLIPFFHFGYLYKEKIESKDTTNNIIYFFVIFLIQFSLIKIYNGSNHLTFITSYCTGFNKNNILLPYMTSLTGILFWLRISKILVPSLKNSKIIYYIGTNTWTIMMHHMFMFFIMNLILFFMAPRMSLSSFNYQAFRTDIYYTYTSTINQASLFYVIFAIVTPIIIKTNFIKIKNNKISFLITDLIITLKTWI